MRTDSGALFELSRLHDAEREETMCMATEEDVNKLDGWLSGSFRPTRRGSSPVAVDHCIRQEMKN